VSGEEALSAEFVPQRCGNRDIQHREGAADLVGGTGAGKDAGHGRVGQGEAARPYGHATRTAIVKVAVLVRVPPVTGHHRAITVSPTRAEHTRPPQL
jgi:hypothetical protein